MATELTVSGLSAVHAEYLAMGGYDFLIGDGRLEYGPEYVEESYYNAQVFHGLSAAFDLQRVANPAYNQARGPVMIPSHPPASGIRQIAAGGGSGLTPEAHWYHSS